MDVSIIIVNYNTCNLICNCINSIFQKTRNISFEVIVVDNGSTDGSQTLLSNDDRIVFIESGTNLGFGKANNLGYSQSHGKYILFLNSDTILINNAIKLFYEKMESIDESIGCLGCFLVDKEGKRIHSYANYPRVENSLWSISPRLFSYLGLKKWIMDPVENMKNDSSFFEVEYVTGADLFIRRTVIDRFGLFDPDFFMYYEDSELQFRYASKGIKSYIYTAPKIVHLEGKSSKLQSNAKNLMLFDSRMSYFKKTQRSPLFYFWTSILLVKSPFTFLKRKYTLAECKKYYGIIFS